MTPARVYHEVRLATGGCRGTEYMSGDKETVSLALEAEWRGRPVVVDMEADRYVHSSGWSEWRVFAQRAREAATEGAGYPAADLTELARRRLGDLLRPEVVAWLESDAYQVSERAAYVSAVLRELSDMRGAYSAGRVRTALAVNADKLGPEARGRFEAALVAYETYCQLVEEVTA